MVRVISVHHFESQSIQTCEEALAVAVAPPDRLLLALPHHVVEVRDLSGTQKSNYSFPTVDRVSFLSYCSTGNYVATVESKISRQEHVYARVYTNWETCKGEDQPMRARIAGRVTPSSSQTGGDVLEMIELPSRFSKITAITPCEETGNIMIACDRVLCLFQLVTRTHDISRQRFLDFELWPVTLELSFSPCWLRMSEDVVAAMNSTSLHVFRLNKGFARASDWSSQSKRQTPKKEAKLPEKDKEETAACPIDLELLLKEVAEGGNKETSKLGNGQIPVLAMLPSLRSQRAHDPSRNLRVSPFKPPGSVVMGVAIKEIPANEPWAEQMTTMVESLLQLELGGWVEEESQEKFTSLALRPLYRINRNAQGKTESSCPRLRSPAYSSLVAFNCLVCTQQEGFMYHFPVEDGEVMSLGKCISEYSFTSVVKFVVLEPSLLHVITSTGLESYSLRTIHAINEDNETEIVQSTENQTFLSSGFFHSIRGHNNSLSDQGLITKKEKEACPPVDEPVCLLGLRPFLGVVNLLLSKSYVVIISSSRENTGKSSSLFDLTIYSLKLPSMESLYKEMMYVGSGHRLSCPTAYIQLLTEAHTLIRSTISVTPCHFQEPFLGQHLQLYRESCALLADYYFTCDTQEDWENGYRYSVMAGLSPTMVMDRLKKLEADALEAGVTISTKEGLGHYLKECLIRCDEDSSLPSGALNRLLELAQAPQADSKTCLVSTLVLQSPLLRQFSTETSIRIITKHLKDSGESIDTQDCLALCVLYIARGKINDASHALDLLQKDNEELVKLLLKYWMLLFDSTKQVNRKNLKRIDWDSVTLSELAVLFIDKRPRDLASILSSLVIDQSTLQLRDILQVFLTYLPARMGSGGCSVTHVLQIFLEEVFNGWYKADSSWHPEPNDIPTLDALKILMRSYLSDMLVKMDQKKPAESQEGNSRDLERMFGGKRPQFLELLPPFSNPETDRSQYSSLLKLQCLLCSGWLDDSVLSELIQFVSEFIPGNMGFNLLVLSQPNKAVEMLADCYPTVLPQYAKDMLTTEPEWKHLIATIQSKADEESESHEESEAGNENGNRLYSRILEVVLNDLARSLSCEVFTRVVPAGKEFEGYILTCQQTAHASHLRDVIKLTGHKLMATLNIKTFT